MAIFVRVEVASRELVPRLLLGLVCAEAGYDVIVGKLKVGHLKEGRVGPARFKPGLLHLKSPAVTPPLYPIYAELQELGYCLSAQDEEAGTSEAVDVDDFFSRRAPRKAYEQLDAYLCWGPRDRTGLARAHPMMDGRTHRTGSPRIDLFRAPVLKRNKAAGAESRERIVLWASSTSPLGKVSPIRAETDYRTQWESSGTAGFWHEWIAGQPSPSVVERLEGISDEYAFLARVVASIEALAAAIPDARIVIRPHHYEDSSAWRSIIGHLPNATVEATGEISDSIAEASLVVHTMSTVGLQARLLGVPTLNFVEPGRKDLPMPLSGTRVESSESLVRAALSVLSSQKSGIAQEEARSLLTGHFDALDGELASERILRVWEDVFDRDLMRHPVVLGRERSLVPRRRPMEEPPFQREGRPFPDLTGKEFPPLEGSDWRGLHEYLVARFDRFSDVRVTPLGPFDALLSTRAQAGWVNRGRERLTRGPTAVALA